jgi:modification methylase
MTPQPALMKLEWPDSFVNQIICGDCMGVMPGIPDQSVDLIVADPPFRVKLGGQTKRTPAYNELRRLDWKLSLKWLSESYRCLKDGGQIYVFTSDSDMSYHRSMLEKCGFGILGKLVWIETNPLPSFTKKCYRGGLNLALHARRGNRTTFFAPRTQQKLVPYWFYPKVGGKVRTKHPTQKPLALVLEWVENSCPPGGLVLDPFVGSGTTAEACIRLGLNFIGIDEKSDYCEIARNRLSKVNAADVKSEQNLAV